MRIKNPIKRIEFEITDSGKFADVAYFFDKPVVIRDIFELRQRWIKGKTIKHNEIDNFINTSDTKEHWGNYLSCRKLAKKYSLGSTFVKPIIAAVLSNFVTDLDYSTAIKEPTVYGTPEDLQLDENVTFTSRRVRKTDLNRLRNKQDDKSISTIKRNREWYWLHQVMGYKKIEKATGKLFETIRSGIRAYEEGLKNYYPTV